MQYRAEIDGLRAVAVLPVLLFHAGMELFAGGYLGVDIFFVISGYLISGIILADLDKGTFSLATFYERRARRILPALSLVIATSIPFAWFFMLPDPLENFGQSVVASMLSVNNILLTLTSGYWDLSSDFKPLIHTWSLGVEEQFYIFFPLLLIALHARWPRKILLIILSIVILSLAAAQFLIENYPTGSFYLLHTRAWELGIGALVACLERRRPIGANGALSALGFALIIVSIFLFDETTPHPSIITALPVIGTALVLLFAKDETTVARLLKVRLFVGIGLISYSLYLWHQPLFAFARILSFEEPPLWLFFALMWLALALSYLSWRFVEQPFRRKDRVSRRGVVVFSVAATLGLSAIGAALHFGQGFPGRVFSNDAETAAGMHIDYNLRIHGYENADVSDVGEPSVLVIGNSQARDFANILIEAGLLDHRSLLYRRTRDMEICNEGTLNVQQIAQLNAVDAIYFPIVDLPQGCRSILANDGTWRDKVVFVGPKHFGYNLNAFVRLDPEGRSDYTTRVFDEILEANRENHSLIVQDRYIDLIALSSDDGENVHIFNSQGAIISADRVHITQAGARYFAVSVSRHAAVASLLGGRE